MGPVTVGERIETQGSDVPASLIPAFLGPQARATSVYQLHPFLSKVTPNPRPPHQGDWSLASGTIRDFPCSLSLTPGSLQLHAFLPSGALLLAWTEVASPASQFTDACLRPATHRDFDTRELGNVM